MTDFDPALAASLRTMTYDQRRCVLGAAHYAVGIILGELAACGLDIGADMIDACAESIAEGIADHLDQAVTGD